MSEELSRACDSLLSTTSLLSHNYGIPKINRTASNNSELQSLEAEYSDLYKELTRKLNKLIYLNKLNELNKESEESINSSYNEIKENLSIVEPSSLKEFLKVQIETFKTDSILNNYLQIALPILRSIHHSNLTLSELNILNNLDKLYSNKSGSIHDLIEEFKSIKQNTSSVNKLNVKLSNMLHDGLSPKFNLLNELNKELNKARLKIIGEKQLKINESDTDSHSEEIKSLFLTLTQKWQYLSILCDLLPSLITSLSIDWFNDKTLFKIIKDCETLSERIKKYQSIININNLNNFKSEDLLMIDFSELE